jgi:hypothetical protein
VRNLEAVAAGSNKLTPCPGVFFFPADVPASVRRWPSSSAEARAPPGVFVLLRMLRPRRLGGTQAGRCPRGLNAEARSRVTRPVAVGPSREEVDMA